MNQITYEVGLERMKRLAEEMGEARKRNEATTRIQLIDRLIFDCLGWSREDLIAEDYERGEYADYVMPQRRRLVLEAKREGATFELPHDLGEITTLEALLSLGDSLVAAIDQVEGYAQRRGVPFAAICNGHQLVAFIGTRLDGVNPRDGRALVFANPTEMVGRFAQLWENLGPTGCAASALYRTLGTTTPTRPPKLSESIAEYPGSARARESDYVLASLQALFIPDYVRDDEKEDEFLEQCYCPPGAYSSLSLVNRSILRTRYSMALGNELDIALRDARDKEGLNSELREEVASSSAGKEPLVLIGGVGVGKTMFLRRLLRVDAKEIASDGVLLYTDLGRDAVIEEIGLYVAASFKQQLLDRYETNIDQADFLRGTYQAEVKRFADGIHGELAESEPDEYRRRQIDHLASLAENAEEHLRRSLQHLVKLRRQQIIVVLDNVDQRQPADQESAFVVAEGIAKNWPCTVFVTLRPETFNASRINSTLSAYQPRAFTVEPPRVERMISKRLDFGADHYRSEGKLPSWLGWTAVSDDLRAYLEILVKSFRRSEALQSTLINLSGGNARRALELMKVFINSPHGLHRQTLNRDREAERDYLVPAHAFLAAALLGDARFYSPTASQIPNLFDVSSEDPREHFLLPALVAMLDRDSNSRDEEGYVSASELYASMQEAGFTIEQVDFALARAISGGWVEVLPPAASAGSIHSLRITAVGSFGHKVLPTNFQYFDAVVVDTPITDPATRGEIQVVNAIAPRLARAEVLLGYLDTCWSQAGLEKLTHFDWPTAAGAVRSEMKSISSHLN
jgi:hypothetical protein